MSCSISMGHICFSVLCPAVFPWDTHVSVSCVLEYFCGQHISVSCVLEYFHGHTRFSVPCPRVFSWTHTFQCPVPCSISMGHTHFSVPYPGVFPWTHTFQCPLPWSISVDNTLCSHHANISSSSCHLVPTHLFPWGVCIGLEFLGPLVLGLCSSPADSVQHLPRTYRFFCRAFIARRPHWMSGSRLCCLLSVCVFS